MQTTRNTLIRWPMTFVGQDGGKTRLWACNTWGLPPSGVKAGTQATINN
jgi:hypothetical protein